MIRALLFPSPPAWAENAALLFLRLGVGLFLVWGVSDNILSADHMREFEAFLANLKCPAPHIAAPLSVFAQAAAGLGLALGLLTRWSGLLIAVNFVVAVLLLSGAGAGPRDLFPPGVLIPIGLLFFARGAGAYALDARFTPRAGIASASGSPPPPPH